MRGAGSARPGTHLGRTARTRHQVAVPGRSKRWASVGWGGGEGGCGDAAGSEVTWVRRGEGRRRGEGPFSFPPSLAQMTVNSFPFPSAPFYLAPDLVLKCSHPSAVVALPSLLPLRAASWVPSLSCIRRSKQVNYTSQHSVAAFSSYFFSERKKDKAQGDNARHSIGLRWELGFPSPPYTFLPLPPSTPGLVQLL